MMRFQTVWRFFGGLIIFSVAHLSPAMTERELMDHYLAKVEEAVDVFEPLWVEGSIPGAGHFDFQGYANWRDRNYVALITTPGNGQVIFCYALLLNETDKQDFGNLKVPRATIEEHALKAIRWIVMTSGHVPGHEQFPISGLDSVYLKDGGYARTINQPHDSLGWFTVGSAMLWDRLDGDTREKMEFVFKGNAQQEREPGGWRPSNGGYHDRVKQNLSSTIGAAWLLRDAAEMARYRKIVTGNAASLVGTEHDYASSATVAGRPMREWALDWNLYPDYSSDHHHWAQIWYGSDMLFEGRYYLQLLPRLLETPVPETATWAGNGYRGVLAWVKSIVTPEGEPASVHGMEYDSYYGSGLLAFAYGATVEQDPVAAALEEQAALMHARQASAVRVYDYHRNSWAKAAAAYLMHKLEGPRAEPLPLVEAMDRLRGTWHYKWQNNLVQRTGDKFVSFAWGSMLAPRGHEEYRYPRGWVMPARNWQPGMEPLVYMHPETLLGRMTLTAGGSPVSLGSAETIYNEWRDDQVFNTTGESADGWLARRGGFHSFEQGPAVWLLSVEARKPARLDWTGVPFHFYAREGVTAPRIYTDAGGSAPLEQPATRQSAWWSVGDRLGVATLGLGNSVTIAREPGYNWARDDAYKDKVDVVAIGGVEGRELKAGETVEAAVVVYPDATAAQVAEAHDRLAGEGVLALPQGWRGVVAPDAIQPGLRHLALTRLRGGAESASLELAYEEGAPVLGVPTVVRGRTAQVQIPLAPLHSHTESFDLYLTVVGNPVVKARRVALGRWRLEPVDSGARVEIRLPGSLSGVKGRWRPDGDRIIPLDLAEGRAVELRLRGPGTIELEGGRYLDEVAPAVELKEFDMQHDGRVKVTVAAADRSNIASVELLCDGASVATLDAEPWIFTHRPGDGLHTWQAVATDASPAANRRESVRRTLEVTAANPPPTAVR